MAQTACVPLSFCINFTGFWRVGFCLSPTLGVASGGSFGLWPALMPIPVSARRLLHVLIGLEQIWVLQVALFPLSYNRWTIIHPTVLIVEQDVSIRWCYLFWESMWNGAPVFIVLGTKLGNEKIVRCVLVLMKKLAMFRLWSYPFFSVETCWTYIVWPF